MPSKIVNDLGAVDPDTCPDFAENFFTPSDENYDFVPCFKFASSPVSREEVLEATKNFSSKRPLIIVVCLSL